MNRSIFLLLLLVIQIAAHRLSARENRILRANCGRYVEGFTSLDGGNKDAQEEWKVLYGDKVKLGEAPWAVSLAMKKKSGSGDVEEYVQHGTGTLISPWHIVSAAHLVGISEDPMPDCDTGEMKDAHFLRNFKDFVAFINVTCATPETCKQLGKNEIFEPIQVKALYIRNGYVGDGCIDRESFNDLAVFELEKPVKFSKNIFPACIPSSPTTPKKGDTGYKLYGYGRDPANKQMETGVLKSLNSFVTDCSDDFPYGGVFCTSANNRGLSCDGDSGSGVVRTASTRDVEELVGVLSAGMPCPELYDTHNRERKRNKKLTQETDLLVDVAQHLEFFCKCCGIC
ncbi:unnamed protein product [Caenorhabditis sp. 36 PRJEB53466]|nr:unnamed protein product [Caenorhabditis sp. 36 PRJEB53466]